MLDIIFGKSEEKEEACDYRTTLSAEQRAEIHKRKPGHLEQVSPNMTFLGRLIDVVGRGIEYFGFKSTEMNADETIKIASFDCSDIPELGDQSGTLRRLKVFFSEIDEQYMPPPSRLGMGSVIKKNTLNRLACINYVREHPEILKTKLKPMIVIAGFPRTGSTLLHNLLSSNPESRALRLWELGLASDPFPPAKNKEQSANDPRVVQCAENLFKGTKIYSDIWDGIASSHKLDPAAYDEELFIFFQCGLLPVHTPLCSLGNKYENEVFHGDVSDVYRFMKLYYQAMQSAFSPDSHWVLKCPFHGMYLPNLVETLPDAKIVFTHRHPRFSVPSYASLVEGFIAQYFPEGELDRCDIGRLSLKTIKNICQNVIEFNKSADPSKFINIRYEETVSIPVETIERIHKHFGIEITEEAKNEAIEYLKNNPQGKHGRKKYTLEEFGLTDEILEAELKDYIAAFCK